ncbi:MAG TPA: GTP cyclohydrolase II [Candidatus Nanoarchaeia archaeon]|nr:GTP cyclohydrolase II [Candidatus Nanoarchaeia archaeon]
MSLQKTLPAELPTSYGQFKIIAYKDARGEHVVLLKGDLTSLPENPLVRIHSQCITGDAFSSRRCDCGQQLELSLNKISKEGGLLIYLQQEGRGIGLFNKMAAYHYQDQGLDTVEANTKLGFKDDDRDYAIAAEILKDLGIKSVRLLTNNPRKIKGLQQAGIIVSKSLPIIIKSNPANAAYLFTKQKRLGHLLQIKLSTK